MKPFICGYWHAWQGSKGVLLSDEGNKILRHFEDTDAMINWLFLEGYKEVARELGARLRLHRGAFPARGRSGRRTACQGPGNARGGALR